MPAAQFLYLTTTGRASGQPREIEIWFTEHDGRHYVIAEYETSSWVQNLRANPQVRWRVGEEEFSGMARVLESGAERDAARERSRQKYGWGDGLVVELLPADS
jgi:deazaflavin-dependent oxidoreductase (nitroreductase family)